MATLRACAGFSALVSLFCVQAARAQDIWATPQAEAQPSTQPAQPAPVAPVAAAQPDIEPAAIEAQNYEARITVGIRQIVLRDFDGAVTTLRRAAQLEPRAPAAFCHLGDAQLEKGVLAEAKAAYESCARFAGLEFERYLVLAQVGLARTVEKSQADVSDKRMAWVRARDAVNEPAAKGLAEARIAAYDAAITREKAHESVRRRIVERDVAREAMGAP
jgi:hypothetical protein